MGTEDSRGITQHLGTGVNLAENFAMGVAQIAATLIATRMIPQSEEVMDHIRDGGSVNFTGGFDPRFIDDFMKKMSMNGVPFQLFNGFTGTAGIWFLIRSLERDIETAKKVIGDLDREIDSRQQTTLYTKDANQYFGNKRTVTVENLSNQEAYMLQDELGEKGIKNYLRRDAQTKTFSITVKMSDIGLSGSLSDPSREKCILDDAMRNVLFKTQSPLAKMYRNHSFHQKEISDLVYSTSRGKADNKIIFDSADPGHYIQLDGEGFIEYRKMTDPATGKEHPVMLGEGAACDPKVKAQLFTKLRSMTSPDICDADKFQTLPDAEKYRQFDRDQKFIAMDARMQKRLDQMHMYEMKLSVDDNGHFRTEKDVTNTEVTFGDFMAYEDRADFADKEKTVKLDAIKDKIDNRLAELSGKSVVFKQIDLADSKCPNEAVSQDITSALAAEVQNIMNGEQVSGRQEQEHNTEEHSGPDAGDTISTLEMDELEEELPFGDDLGDDL